MSPEEPTRPAFKAPSRRPWEAGRPPQGQRAGPDLTRSASLAALQAATLQPAKALPSGGPLARAQKVPGTHHQREPARAARPAHVYSSHLAAPRALLQVTALAPRSFR